MTGILLALAKYGPMFISGAGDVKEFFTVINQAQAEDRDLTPEEMARIDAAMARSEEQFAALVEKARAEVAAEAADDEG